MPDSTTGKFIFSNKADALFISLKQILYFAADNLPSYANTPIITFKLKSIITELLSNAVKHAGNTETIIYLSINDDRLSIKKIDSGHPFNPPELHLDKESAGAKMQLSKDPLHRVYAIVDEKRVVRFVCEENQKDKLSDLNDLAEHLGILIITKSADEFIYQFDEPSGLNTFQAIIYLPKR